MSVFSASEAEAMVVVDNCGHVVKKWGPPNQSPASGSTEILMTGATRNGTQMF